MLGVCGCVLGVHAHLLAPPRAYVIHEGGESGREMRRNVGCKVRGGGPGVRVDDAIGHEQAAAEPVRGLGLQC